MSMITALGVVLAAAHVQTAEPAITVTQEAPFETSGAFAQVGSNEIGQCLTMVAAVENAINFDPRIDAARAERDIARAQVVAAYARNKPLISAFGQLGFGDTPPLDRRRDDQIGLQLDQELFSFGARRNAQQSAEFGYRSATYGVEDRETAIALGVAQAYLEYARAAEVADLAQEQTEAFADDAEAAATRLERRIITLTDASQIRSRYASARSQLVNSEVAEQVALTRLEVLADESISCLDQESIREFVAPEAPRVLALAPEAAVDEAMANSARVRRARSDVASARARVAEISKANLPTISLDAYSLTSWESSADADGIESTDQIHDSRIGLNLTQQIYTGGQNTARKMEAHARLRTARADERLQRISVNDQIQANLAQAKARRQAGVDLLEALDQASIQFEYTKREYERGTKTLTDLVLASDSYFTAAQQEVDARYGFYNALLNLYAAMGLLTEDGLY